MMTAKQNTELYECVINDERETKYRIRTVIYHTSIGRSGSDEGGESLEKERLLIHSCMVCSCNKK